MSNPPPQPSYVPQPFDQDTSHLNTLSIFYFILAGLQCLAMCIFSGYIVFGVFVGVAGMSGANQPGDAAPAAALSGFFICIGVFAMAVVGVFAFLNFLTGKSLRQRKRLTLVYIMAALVCLNVPLGTVLGVFTFVVLSRPSIKASFDVPAAGGIIGTA